ncbi:hypothetical protein L596_022131 [Steinernema carpocapsae]|uniref:EF-hand domain-containing protein n=1 Tax=Steinernema carpocapsae TaxID=34508 RepID=A0A4U5MLN5_STECR|nr:hypothetical protein L596_022131 [Steinernema carpocapsae]
MASVEQLQTIYAQHDADGNGTLDKAEAHKAVLALGDHACHEDFDQHFNKVAVNGVIDFEAFKTFAKGFHSH